MRQRVNLRSPLFLQYESRPAEVESENLQVYSEEFDNAAWTKSRVTITANSTISPNGELTADKITGTGTGSSYVFDGVSLTSGNTYTISIFVKPIIGISSFAINVFGGVGTAYFNLTDKSINTTTGDFTSSKIEDYGNGWLRCSGTLTLSGTTGSKNIGYGLIDYNGDQLYLWGAQVEQQEQATSYIKTEGTTVTRAATTEAQEEDVTAELRIYSGGGGYDYARTNLQVYSEEFDNAAWSKTRTTITADQGLAPNGTNTADKFTGTGTGASYIVDGFNFTSGEKYTISVYVKPINVTTFRIYKFSGGIGAADFNLSTGTIINASGAMSNPIIESLSSGWFRCSVEHTPTATGSQNYGFGLQDYSGDQYYIWGAMLEEGSQVTSYIKTEATTVTELAYQTEAPTEATYTLTKSPENGKTTFEIAELIRDYIEQTTTKSSGTIWADVKLFDNLQMNRHYYFLGTEGYIDNTEGLQTYLNAPSNETFMQSNATVLIPEGQSLEIPVNAQYNSFYTITTGGVEGSAVYFSNLDDNSTQVEYITVNSTDEVVKLYVDSVVTEEITIQETECSKYADHLLMFVNKYGSKQDFYVNMKSTERFKIKDDGFSRSVIDYSTLSVNNGIHSYKRRVLESKESYTLNTPFLDEENVEAFEELLLSEYVWLKKEGESYIPVVVKDMSMTRKTHLNDKLIQYTVEVESANHLVNIQR